MRQGVTDEFILPTNLTENGATRRADRQGRQHRLLQFPSRPRAADYPHVLAGSNFPSRTPRRARRWASSAKRAFSPPPMSALPSTIPLSKTSAWRSRPTKSTIPCPNIFPLWGMKQLHIAETEKYAHVTFFLQRENRNARRGRNPHRHSLPEGGHL